MPTEMGRRPLDGPLTDFHRHEVLHTASIIADMFEQFIVDHRFTRADPALMLEAEAVSEALHDFYQRVGQTMGD